MIWLKLKVYSPAINPHRQYHGLGNLGITPSRDMDHVRDFGRIEEQKGGHAAKRPELGDPTPMFNLEDGKELLLVTVFAHQSQKRCLKTHPRE